jgi:uncharacterized protein YndB with AHSA1/START domain
MSKKKKVSTGKAAKKSTAKKPVKKASKPVAKKPVKKSATKPLTTKKSATKSAKKTAKKAVVKKSAPVVKKVIALVKKVVKGAKSAKPSKNPIKKSIAPAVTKSSTKPVAKTNSKPLVAAKVSNNKPAIASNGSDKKIKSHIVVPPPVFKKETKAPVVAPTKPAEAPKKGEKKSTDVLAITNTIPVKKLSEISQSKIASISHSITNPVRKTDSYSVRPEKEPAGKFEMEFVVHSSAEMLYEFLSTPSGLSEWFCDDLNIRNGIYTFIWDDQLQQARLLKTIDLQLVRFQWVDKTDGSYFEFRIQRDDLTNDIALIITDFAETPSERESSKLLWHSQIEKLMHVIGSIF